MSVRWDTSPEQWYIIMRGRSLVDAHVTGDLMTMNVHRILVSALRVFASTAPLSPLYHLVLHQSRAIINLIDCARASLCWFILPATILCLILRHFENQCFNSLRIVVNPKAMSQTSKLDSPNASTGNRWDLIVVSQVFLVLKVLWNNYSEFYPNSLRTILYPSWSPLYFVPYWTSTLSFTTSSLTEQ